MYSCRTVQKRWLASTQEQLALMSPAMGRWGTCLHSPGVCSCTPIWQFLFTWNSSAQWQTANEHHMCFMFQPQNHSQLTSVYYIYVKNYVISAWLYEHACCATPQPPVQNLGDANGILLSYVITKNSTLMLSACTFMRVSFRQSFPIAGGLRFPCDLRHESLSQNIFSQNMTMARHCRKKYMWLDMTTNWYDHCNVQ